MLKAIKGCQWVLATTVLTTLVFAPAKAEELKLWRHGVVEAKSDAGIVFMPSKGGFAEKQGLKIEIKQFKGDTLALKALLAGELESYEGNPGSPMVAASRGADIKLVGCYWPGLTYAIYSKPDIKTPADLKGRTVAINATASVVNYELGKMLETVGLSIRDVELKVIPFPQMGVGLANKAVDAAVVIPPWAFQLVDQRIGVVLADVDDHVTPRPLVGHRHRSEFERGKAPRAAGQ